MAATGSQVVTERPVEKQRLRRSKCPNENPTVLPGQSPVCFELSVVQKMFARRNRLRQSVEDHSR